MYRRFYLPFTVWIGLAILLLTPQTGNTQVKERTTLSYQTLGNYGAPGVQVQVQDRHGSFQNALSLLDTGSNLSVITDTLAARLGLHPEPAFNDEGKPVFIAPGKQAKLVHVAMKVGDLSYEGTPLFVVKASLLDSPVQAPLDGALCTNALLQFAVDFDFQQHQITLLYPGNLSSDELKRAGMLDATVLPKATADGFYFPLAVRLNDQVDVNLPIDTGGAMTYLPLKVVQQLNLKPSSRPEEIDTLYGKLKTKYAIVQTLAIGPLVFKDIEIQYAEHDQAFLPTHIGMDILSKYHLLIDYPANKLYLKPAQPARSETN